MSVASCCGAWRTSLGRGVWSAGRIICSKCGAPGVFWARLKPYGDLSMGLRWPCAARRSGAKPHGAAETGGGQGQRPLWAREHHAKPGFKELLTLILGQPPRRWRRRWDPPATNRAGRRRVLCVPNGLPQDSIVGWCDLSSRYLGIVYQARHPRRVIGGVVYPGRLCT